MTETLQIDTTGTLLNSLFEPTRVAGLDLANAFAMAPMTRYRSPGGVPTATVAEYYRRRTEGGIGLIITEGILVDHPSAGSESTVPRLSPPDATTGWTAVVDAVHGAGGRIFAQLWHQGSERIATDGFAPWTPSGVREDGTPIGYAMTDTDIATMIARCADAGAAAARAGFDGIEVHAAHGYLLDEFLWPETNRRTDRYGGDPAGRARFVSEIIAALRAATGPGYPIAVRFSQFKERDYGATIAADPHELARLLEPMTSAGATMMHASTRRVWEPAFAGSARTLAGWTRSITGLPTIAVGSVGLRPADLFGTQGSALDSLARLRDAGEFDLLAIGRALLGNPGWVHQVATGRVDEIIDYNKQHEELYP